MTTDAIRRIANSPDPLTRQPNPEAWIEHCQFLLGRVDELEAENERLKVLLKLGTDFTLQGKGEQS